MRTLLAVWLLIASASLAFARPADVGFGGFSKRLWEAGDGLPDQTVQAFAQTADGSLWIGTKGGLFRFDGVQFTAYGHESDVADLERGVNSLLVARDGSLWIGTEGAGLIHYRSGRFERCPTTDGKTNSFIRTIFQDQRGSIWVGADQGLFRVSNSSLVRIDGRNQIPTIFVRSITEDLAGHIWVGGTELLEFSGSSFLHQYPLPGRPAANVITAMMLSRDGTLWVGMLSGLYRLEHNGSLVRISDVSAQVSVFAETRNGTVWIGTVGHGLFYSRDSRLFHIAPSNLPSNTIHALSEDQEGNLWLGTQAGLVRLSRTPISIIPFPGGADSEFETLYLDHDQSVWVAASSQLFHIRDGVAQPFEFPELPKTRIRTLMRDRKGDLWIGTGGAGLVHLARGEIERFYADHGLCNNFVRAILESRDGTIWVGTDGGLTHVMRGESVIYEPSGGLAYFSITALFEDRDGNIWVGTSRGLSRLTKGKITQDATTAALAHDQLWSINQDESGVIWFGMSNGLYGLKDGRLVHITTANGLVSDSVFQILRDGRGNIWLSGPNSVARMRESALDEFMPGGRIDITFYADAYSLNSAGFYSGMQPEGAVASNGDVWFPSSKGAVHISGNKIFRTPPSPVSITAVMADGQSLPFDRKITLRPGNGRLEIAYAAIHLGEQGGLRYRYQMEGLEPWIDAGTRRTAYYTHIPPGSYRFRVQAYEIDNRKSVTEASILIVQQPHFYTTYWFVLGCALGLSGLGFLVHRFRIHQMRLQFQAVSAERIRLAREMHDTVIQGCVGVSTLLEAAQGIEGNDEPLRQHLLGYATEQVRSTIEAARESVWALRNSTTADSNLATICQELARHLQSESGVSIRCEVSGVPFHLGDEATRELQMIIREALNNALAHAAATAIRILVSFREKELSIEIADDGRGFNLNEVILKNDHYGIIGMTERVQLVGGTLAINSQPGKGTSLHLDVPRRKRAKQWSEKRK